MIHRLYANVSQTEPQHRTINPESPQLAELIDYYATRYESFLSKARCVVKNDLVTNGVWLTMQRATLLRGTRLCHWRPWGNGKENKAVQRRFQVSVRDGDCQRHRPPGNEKR